MKKVVIYTGNLCIHCDWAMELLNRKNIEFKEYNIAKDMTKREERVPLQKVVILYILTWRLRHMMHTYMRNVNTKA